MTLQAAGDYAAAKRMIETLGVVRPEVQRVLDRLAAVPVDIAPQLHVGGVLRRRRAAMARTRASNGHAPTLTRTTWRRASAPRRLAAGVLVVAGAVALAWAPMDPAWVERVYSRGWYPAFQPIVTSLSSLAPGRVARCVDRAGAAGHRLVRLAGRPRAVGQRAFAPWLAR